MFPNPFWFIHIDFLGFPEIVGQSNCITALYYSTLTTVIYTEYSNIRRIHYSYSCTVDYIQYPVK